MATIPVQNVYYLLCYAWNRFESGQLVDVASLESTELVDLFAKVLVDGTNHLLRRGLDRGYRTYSREIAGVRGQVDFDGSLKKMLFQQGKAQCRVDELTHDVLHNRLLKATLRHLSRLDSLDSKLRARVRRQVRHFRQVGDLPRLNPLLFHRVQLHRNNRFYRFLLDVCELIARNLLVSEETGETRFRDILRDEITMNQVFEDFVRNFYAREHPEFRAGADTLHWGATADDPAHLDFLPSMRTDITLRSPERVVIIDTKYYKHTLQTGRWGGHSVHSGHLYQLYAYLRSFARSKANGRPVEGMLLYPVVDRELRLDYEIDGFPVRVCTVDLAQEWRGIEAELMGLAT